MIIGVWGSSSAGKSTVAVKTALALAKHYNVILVDTNFVTPQLQVWYPNIKLDDNQSLSRILNNDIFAETLTEKISVIYDNLGVLGYKKGEITINAIPHREDTVKKLLTELDNIADIVVVDCQSNITQDILSFEAVMTATQLIVVTKADINSAAWVLNNMPMISNKPQEVIKVVNKISNYTPLDVFENEIGSVDYYLPFDEDVYIELLQGEIGKTSFGNNQFSKSIRDIAERIGD